MSGKAKSNYLSVTNIETRKVVLHKVFFKMGDLNKFIATDEFKVTYPSPIFQVTKETY